MLFVLIRRARSGKDLEDVLVGVSRRREVTDVRLRQMSAKFLGEIRAERIRGFAEIALVDRLAGMQTRRQHVLPEVLLRNIKELLAI